MFWACSVAHRIRHIHLVLVSFFVTLTPQYVIAQCAPPQSGLVSWWTGDIDARDSVGANHGTFHGGMTAGVPGGPCSGVFRFDGTDDFITVNANSSLNLSSFTIRGIFLKQNTVPTELFEYHTGGDEADFGPHVFDQGDSSLFANIVDTSLQHHILFANGVLSPNVWYCYALTYDQATGQGVLYLDGEAVDEETFSPPFLPRTNLDVYIGHRPHAQYFHGWMDDIMLFNRALTPDEVASLCPAIVSVDPQALSLAPDNSVLYLYQNFPNPFNPFTTVRYWIGDSAPVSLSIFDVSGRLINSVPLGVQSPGTHEWLWSGRDGQGLPSAAGVYLLRIRAGSSEQTRTMVYMR